MAVLGPQSIRNSDHIKSICDNSEIPFIETRPALTERDHQSSINLHPDPDKLGDILGKIYKIMFKTQIIIFQFNWLKDMDGIKWFCFMKTIIL